MPGGGVDVQGAEQLAALAKRLRAAGDEGKGLRKELLRGIRKAAAPLRTEMRAHALETLPKKGGLNQRVASQKFTLRTSSSGRSVGIRLLVVGVSIRNVRAIDRGTVRHPVFGHGDRSMWRWVPEPVRPGAFTVPFETHAPRVRAHVKQAMATVSARITHGGG